MLATGLWIYLWRRHVSITLKFMNFSNFHRCMDFAPKPHDNQILLNDSLFYLGRSQHTPLWPTWCRSQYRRRCHRNMRYPVLPVEISSNISSYTLTNKHQSLSSISFFFTNYIGDLCVIALRQEYKTSWI